MENELDDYLKLSLEGRGPGKLTVYISLYSIIMYIIQLSLLSLYHRSGFSFPLEEGVWKSKWARGLEN
jgi:hypothetical protein